MWVTYVIHGKVSRVNNAENVSDVLLRMTYTGYCTSQMCLKRFWLADVSVTIRFQHCLFKKHEQNDCDKWSFAKPRLPWFLLLTQTSFTEHQIWMNWRFPWLSVKCVHKVVFLHGLEWSLTLNIYIYIYIYFFFLSIILNYARHKIYLKIKKEKKYCLYPLKVLFYHYMATLFYHIIIIIIIYLYMFIYYYFFI